METAQTSVAEGVPLCLSAGAPPCVDGCPAIHLVIGLDGTVRAANRALEELLGYGQSELLGRHVLEFVVPQDSGKVLEELERGTAGQYVRDLEVDVLAKDGSVRTLLLAEHRSAAERKSAGEAIALTGVDISERRRLRQVLGEAERRMEEFQRLRWLGRLAEGIARQFGDVLTIISGNAELLQAGRPGRRERDAAVGEILRAAGSAAALVRRLLALGRTGPAPQRAVDVHRLIGDVAEHVKGDAGRGIEVTCAAEAAACTVAGDAEQLRECLLELARNACQAMGHDGRLSFATEVASAGDCLFHLPPDVGLDRPYLHVTVGDTGAGMDAPSRQQAFEPFFTTDGDNGHSGLGLACVYACVQAHGGDVRIASRPGHGTQVHLYLPLMDARLGALPAAQA